MTSVAAIRPTLECERSEQAVGRLSLVVLGDGRYAVHPLPAGGVLSVGRSPSCDVCIDHASISRQHAVLHLGPPLAVEDAGSSNGTRVRGEVVAAGARAAIVPGEVVELGPSIRLLLDSAVQTVGDGDRDRDGDGIDALVERVAAGRISVLILGETGVGKERLAERVHELSPRASRPFLRLNCAALSESLLESELFGHERGAFTGAVAAKPGLLETAQGGTVFLDEVGEMPLPTQVKLLRVIEERVMLRVGGLRPTPIDVRFVAATNRDLDAEVERGGFRKDLFFRLDGITLRIPPLRERVAEIEGLARRFLRDGCRQLERADEPGLSREALAVLRAYAWPGNIRELRNVMERAVLLCSGAWIAPAHLPLDRLAAVRTTGVAGAAAVPAAVAVATDLDTTLVQAKRDVRDAERRWILAVLEECGGNQTLAAQRLAISRRTLLARLDDYGVPRPRKRCAAATPT